MVMGFTQLYPNCLSLCCAAGWAVPAC